MFRLLITQARTHKIPPTLDLHDLLPMARYAWQDPDLDLFDLESIAASLIDQGYIKAYILHSKSLIVFKKDDEMGIVRMNTVFPKDPS